MTTTERKFTKLNELEARSLLGTDEARCYIPEIKVVTNAPVLYMQGGKLFQANVGYNDACGVYVKEGVGDVPIVPPAKAKAALLDLLSEFNFATPGDFKSLCRSNSTGIEIRWSSEVTLSD